MSGEFKSRVLSACEAINSVLEGLAYRLLRRGLLTNRARLDIFYVDRVVRHLMLGVLAGVDPESYYMDVEALKRGVNSLRRSIRKSLKAHRARDRAVSLLLNQLRENVTKLEEATLSKFAEVSGK